MKKLINHIQLIFNKKAIFYWVSFLLPGLIFLSYFLYSKSGILTVDLGQQYIDFLAFLRQNLFTHPLRLIYSFSNGLGGSMLATDAYYLLSPFNLLLFLFPEAYLPEAILILITLKVASAGLSSYSYWQKQTKNHFYALAASSAYALSGYVIANHFNLMWLDAVILLPLLIKAIDNLLSQRQNHLILITFLLWLTNFYTAFMTLLFGLLYFLSQIFLQKQTSKTKWHLFGLYLRQSVWGSFLDAFLLLPVFIEMLQGKAATAAKWSWGFQFTPYKEIAKLALGAYNFREMQTGMPNIYFTMPFLLLTLLYFLSRRINWQHKLANGLLLIFLIASLCWTPLVLLWHLGQFPVWYPGRFSFVLIFFTLNLGLIALKQTEELNLVQTIVLAVFSLALILFLVLDHKQFDFLNQNAQIISGAFLALALLFLVFIKGKNKFSGPILALIVAIELTANLFLSLNNLSYQNNSDYRNFAQNMAPVIQTEKKSDSTLFRTEKSFYRSDDDPFTANYYGLSSFNSISDQHVLNLMNNLGFLSNSNSYTNYGGTPVTDALMGIKYYLIPNYEIQPAQKGRQMKYDNENHRVDISDYPVQKRFRQLILMKNPHALPLLFLNSAATQHIKFESNNIPANQQKFFEAATGKKTKLFQQVDWPQVKLSNAKEWPQDSLQFARKNNTLNSRIILTFTPRSNDSYYLDLGGEVSADNATMTVNNTKVDLSLRDQKPRLISLGSQQKGQRIQISLTFKNNNLNLSTSSFWSINENKLDQTIDQLPPQPIFHHSSPLVITSNKFTTKKAVTVDSTIPANMNWLILDNHHRLQPNKILFMNTFLNFNLKAGPHQLTLIYLPWVFLLGLLISIITLILRLCLRKKYVSANI